MEQPIIANGGLQYVPQIAIQYVYLDFDGESTSYNGEILTVDTVKVQDSALTEERIAYIVAELNAKYADQNVIFVTEKPDTAEYSTIYIGKTSAFDEYGTFAGLAETIDSGNQNKTDKAFVMLDSTASNEQIISTISHETDHLLGTLDHGDDGLAAYAVRYDVSSGSVLYGQDLYGHSMYVSSGGSVINTLVRWNGGLNILEGGFADDTNICSDGTLIVHSGGNASRIYMSGGICWVYDGAIAKDISVSQRGTLYILSGGTATNIVERGGDVVVWDGACVTFAGYTFSDLSIDATCTLHSGTTAYRSTVNSRGSINISSGGTANSTTVNKSGYLRIYKDGFANSVTVNSGGNVLIASGGRAANTTLSGTYLNSASMRVFSGGSADNIVLNHYGQVSIENGGIVSNVSVNSGGMLIISSGGTATAVNWTPCRGKILAAENAHVVFTSNYSGVYFGINNDLYEQAEKIVDRRLLHGSMYVMSAGIVSNTVVDSGGELYIHPGGYAGNNTVKSGGFLTVSSGGSATSNHISNGGTLNIFGGVTDSTTLYKGGNMIIFSGGTANEITVNSGAVIAVNSGGSANEITVNSGAVISVNSGGIATGIIWTPCVGMVYAEEGAVVTYKDQYSGVYWGSDNQLLSSAHYLEGKEVCGDTGSMFVYSSGKAEHTSVHSGGNMYISSGGKANYTKVCSGGSMFVYSGGKTYYTYVNNGGLFCPFSGAIVDSPRIYGSMIIADGVIADSASVYGKFYISSGGTANSAWCGTRGSIFVSDGGVANDTAVSSNGCLIVSSGGVTNRTRLFSSGSMCIYSNGSAENTSITSSGHVFVSDGGLVKNTTVATRGTLFISSGGAANDTVISGGSLYISSGGVANDITIDDWGYIYIFSGGVANNTTLSDWYNYLYISSGGIASNTIISGGSLYISSGGEHRGSLQIVSGGVTADSGSVIDFSLTGRSFADGYLINKLSSVWGTPEYSVTVADNQLDGVYKLAQGAENFSGNITVGNGTLEYGMLTMGETFQYNNVSYLLKLSGGDLTLIINGSAELKFDAGQDGMSITNFPGENCTAELSKDNFQTVIAVNPPTHGVDTFGMSSGTYCWRATANGSTYFQSSEFTVADANVEPQLLRSEANGNMDLFFANADGTWIKGYAAEHHGVLNGWSGTKEQVMLSGKNKIADMFSGSDDANILVMTDDTNGDALFVDDVYTSFGKNAARIAQIDEIRAGFGDDIVDMTSQRFEYVGDGVKIYGGLGNDTIWANNGNNTLFGDAGNDRIVGGANNDVIVGGIGNDSLHGGGGDDIFCFGENWGEDTVEQLVDGEITLWFESGSENNWNADTLTYTDGTNSVKVSGVSADNITLTFGDVNSLRYDELTEAGCFDNAVSEKVFEDKNKSILATM